MNRLIWSGAGAFSLAVAVLAGTCEAAPQSSGTAPPVVAAAAQAAGQAAHAVAANTTPLQHIIIIMQENRSFDNYFGTFPGANGFPQGLCEPIAPKKPQLGCVAPFHDPFDINAGGSHGGPSAQGDIDDGITTAKQDGYIANQELTSEEACKGRGVSLVSCIGVALGGQAHDVMGYHTADEIPNYWAYASQFVLQDAMFAGERDYSYPSHLDLTSEWAANCTDNTNAMTCTTGNAGAGGVSAKTTQLPWSSLFQLLDTQSVSWKYYVDPGTEPDCPDGDDDCTPPGQNYKNASIWNPAPLFLYVKQQGKAYLNAHLFSSNQFVLDVQNGNLAQVSWIIPSNKNSEHPPSGVTMGMEYVTRLVNAVMLSPYWNNTAIFIAWDDWGGFYDHYTPPNMYFNSSTAAPVEGFGLRVPGLMISTWAKGGSVDHQIYSFDQYATLIEDLFAGGARLNPAALGNPDNRGVIRDAITQVTFLDGTTKPIGNLMSEFDFKHKPLPPLILSTAIPTGIAAVCGETQKSLVCASTTVTLSWNAVGVAQTPGPFTYHVQRDGTELPGCVGSATSCTDTPGSGTHVYRAYTISAGGVQSPLSAAAEAVMP
jgi:phospholipase C